MPKRTFLGISDDDRQDIDDIVRRRIEEATR